MSFSHQVVWVVHRDPATRQWLESLVGREGWECREALSPGEFLAYPELRVPGCLLLEASGSDPGWPAAQQRIALSRPQVPLILLGEGVDLSMVVQGMKAGALEFFTTPCRPDAVRAAIWEALERSRLSLAHEAELQGLRQAYTSLSPRERDVMALVAAGYLNKQVGGRLGISEITVKAHRGRVMRKMKADSLPALVRMAAGLELPVAGPKPALPALVPVASGRRSLATPMHRSPDRQ